MTGEPPFVGSMSEIFEIPLPQVIASGWSTTVGRLTSPIAPLGSVEFRHYKGEVVQACVDLDKGIVFHTPCEVPDHIQRYIVQHMRELRTQLLSSLAHGRYHDLMEAAVNLCFAMDGETEWQALVDPVIDALKALGRPVP